MTEPAPRWGAPAIADGPAALVVGALPADAAMAIAAAEVRTLAIVEWRDLPALDGAPAADLLIAAVPSDIGHGPLEALAAAIDDTRLPGIVLCEAEALDAVAAVLLRPDVALLCEPDPADWATALAVAAHRAGADFALVREGEAERLRRLHAEVARIAAQLAALAEAPLAAASDSVDERRQRYAPPPEPEFEVDAAAIRQLIRARRLRAHYFDPRLLEDPGWDMLLDLFAADLEGTQVSVSSLCIAAAVAPTTALRWIGRMAEAGLMVRLPDAGDRRRAFVALSAGARTAMRAYVAAAHRADLPLV